MRRQKIRSGRRTGSQQCFDNHSVAEDLKEESAALDWGCGEQVKASLCPSETHV